MQGVQGILEEFLTQSGELRGAQIRSIRLQAQSLFALYRCSIEKASAEQCELALKLVDSPKMARAEFEGLEALRDAGARIPKLYGLVETKHGTALVMDFVSERGASPAELLASLHRLYEKRASCFGWPHDNFIGRLAQPNSEYKDFSSYWMQSRIEPQLRLALRQGRLQKSEAKRVRSRTREAIACFGLDDANLHPPVLIHGDLWSGNVLGSYLIDPSVSHGNPEQDLAMLRLFGSPLSMSQMTGLLSDLGRPAGFEKRIGFWQVYPLLVHVNLFGSSYVRQLMNALDL